LSPTSRLTDSGNEARRWHRGRDAAVRFRALVRLRGHLPSCFEQHFSAASQSIGPTKNAVPTQNNPRAVKTTYSPDIRKLVVVRRHTPLRRKNVNDKPAPIRASVFIMVFGV
jgi:hypothetical protein